MSRILSLDSETHYSEAYTVADLGPWHYCHDERFDCYMISLADNEGWRWTGHPSECDWGRVFGEDVTLLSHNTGFDMAVIERLHELGKIPKPVYAAWHDTADLSAYLGAPRSLAGASEMLLGQPMSKEMRGHMKGKQFSDLPAEKQAAMLEYAQKDADNCLALWLKHGDRWPEHERWLSAHTREMGRKGMPVNIEKVKAGILTLQAQKDEALGLIPWAAESGTPLSKKLMAVQCEKDGIEMPTSMAKDSEECAAWEDKYADTYPWIRAVRNYRRVNMLLEKLLVLRDRTVNGWFKYGLKYFGASVTGRWSGDAGFNIQNIMSKPMFGIDMRSMFEAPEGYTFVTVDLSNIEPRVLAWLAGDHDLLEQLRTGMDIYEAHARNTMGYREPEPLKAKAGAEPYMTMRKLSKARVIGLGYRCGKEKFVDVARIIGNLTLSLEESERTVNDYRSTNRKITDFWKKLDRGLRSCCGTGQSFKLQLPSGRIMEYHDIQDIGGMSAVTCRNGKMMRSKIYDGLVTENGCQGTARDVIAWHLIKCVEAMMEVVMHAHDELVFLVEESKAQEALDTALRIMHTAPPWMPGLPVAAEGMITKHYCK